MLIRITVPILSLLFASMSSISIAAESELKSMEQKFSYTMGYTFGQQMASQVVNVDQAVLIAAIEDVFAKKEAKISKKEMTEVLNTVKAKISKVNQEQANKTLEVGKKFLEQNKKVEGMVVLPNGIQYLEIKKGEGSSPKKDSTVTVNYVGTHLNGSVFDASKRHGGPATFNLARVIPGFREAISLMQKGSKWQVFIPSELAYGKAGSPPDIHPNDTLVFDIELLSFKDAK
ncbi:MAG: FKBP-type peptidyl-prolyl cis-trans isomerase [Gammaproteobacteria bacterium]|nr:FKBP-type peptidyl-prolyl cis-trans isomerase [Gammaproteobacteria bacterium]